MISKRRNVVLVAVAVFGIGFIYFLATFVVPKILVTMTKAAPATKISMSNSYLLGSKILCKADGTDKCGVNVFLGDSEGRPVAGKIVALSTTGVEAEVLPEAQKSDQNGKTGFTITSNREGQVNVAASVDGTPMEKSVVVTFRGN